MGAPNSASARVCWPGRKQSAPLRCAGGLAHRHGSRRRSPSLSDSFPSPPTLDTQVTLGAGGIARSPRGSDPALLLRGSCNLRLTSHVHDSPGRELCAAATAWSAVLVLRASRHSRPEAGPRSVAHTARFVLDHAPARCSSSAPEFGGRSVRPGPAWSQQRVVVRPQRIESNLFWVDLLERVRTPDVGDPPKTARTDVG